MYLTNQRLMILWGSPCTGSAAGYNTPHGWTSSSWRLKCECNSANDGWFCIDMDEWERVTAGCHSEGRLINIQKSADEQIALIQSKGRKT